MDKHKYHSKLKDAQRVEIFKSVLTGSTLAELSVAYNVTEITIRNAFWRIMHKTMYLSQKIPFDVYFHRACCQNSAKSINIKEIRANADYWMAEYESHVNHKLTLNSLLMHLDLGTATLRLLASNGIRTIEGYLNAKDLNGISNSMHTQIKSQLENLCLKT